MRVYNTCLLKLSASFFLSLIISNPAFSEDGDPDIVSSLCGPSDVENMTCEDERECAFKLQSSIEKFFLTYQVPTPENLSAMRYPQKCLYRSYQEEAVNITFDILPTGKPKNVEVLNSSNECFDRSARNHVRRMRFHETQTGHSCVPWTMSFKRPTLSDASGASY